MPGVRSTLPWRGVIIALLPALAAGSAVRTAPAQSAQAGAVPMLIDLRLRVTPAALDVCVDETRHVFATVVGRQARVPPQGQRPRWRTSYVPGMNVATQVGNPSVGSLSPQTARTQSFASFQFRGQSTGVTTLTFDMSNNSATPTAPIAHATFQPTEIIQAKVRSCMYHLHVISQWQSRTGFRPAMASTFEADLDLRPTSPGRTATVDVTAEVTNVAFGSPVSSCVPSFSAPKTTVDIHATRSRDGRILVSFFYEPVRVSTMITCPRVGGGRRDIGAPLAAPMLNLRFDRNVTHRERRHDLITPHETVRGRTYVNLTEIP